MVAPNLSECTSAEDVGKLHHDADVDVWYECVHDKRRDVITWSALPPNEDEEHRR